MKKYIPILLITGVLAILPFQNKAKADPQRPAPGAVVFSAQQHFENGIPKTYYVLAVSQGQHAPTILPGTDLATAIEALLAQGFDVQTLPGLQFMAIRK